MNKQHLRATGLPATALWVLLISSALLQAQATADEADSADKLGFAVMTWNVEWFFDDYKGDNFADLAKEQSAPSRAAWNWKRDAVAAAIHQIQPSVVALQEVEGQRVLFYLERALERNHQAAYDVGFAEGGDYFTEQDVGFLYGSQAHLVNLSLHRASAKQRADQRYSQVTKHIEGVFEVPVGDRFERVTIMNLHLRARPEGESIRIRQARLAHAWLAERIAAGEHVIVLGDTNSELTEHPLVAGSDLGALTGRDTDTPEDDLVDLSEFLQVKDRGTHLLAGKQYDRIFVSRGLIEDEPGRLDLVFDRIEIRSDVNVRGTGVDTPAEHWDGYWSMAESERDISDHHPVVARFVIK